MSDYDTYLANCVENYMNPQVCELTIKGRSLFDVIAEKDGVQEVFFRVPLSYWKNIDFTDGHYTWDDVCDEIEEYHFDLAEVERFEFDDIINEDDETYLPDDYTITKIIGFSSGRSFEDLTVEE